MRVIVGLFAVAGTCAFLAHRNNLGSNLTDSNWKEVAAKVSQNAGPVLKGSLPFIAAALVTGCSTLVLSSLAAKKIYPMRVGFAGSTYLDEDTYKKLSASEKVSRALILVLIGTATGAGLGGAMMKGATVAFQISPRYFKNSM